MNTALVIAKEVAKAASSYGIGYMGGEICKALTPENISTVKKVCITIGGSAVAGAVAFKAGSYIDEVADAIDDSIKAVKEVIKEKKSAKKEEEKIEVETKVEEEKPKKTSKKKTTKKETEDKES